MQLFENQSIKASKAQIIKHSQYITWSRRNIRPATLRTPTAFGVLACVRSILILLTLFVGGQSIAAPTEALPSCTSKIRANYVKLQERDEFQVMLGTTALLRALTKRVLEVSGLEFELQEVPYARAIAEYSSGKTDVLMLGEAALRGSDPNGLKVPMMNMQVALFTKIPPHRYPLANDSSIGVLRGFPVPDGLLPADAKKYSVTSIDSLMKMLVIGRITHAYLVQANADLYMSRFPEFKNKIQAAAVVGSLRVDTHINSRLAPSCSERLKNAAMLVQRTDMASIFEKVAPELNYESLRIK